jgi:hypothetical protein
MEQSTPENEASVRRVCDLVTAARESGGAVTADQQIIYDVDYEQALQVAFPKGIPSTDAEKSDLTEWSEEQDQALRELFPAFEDQNGRITNVLAAYAKRVGA